MNRILHQRASALLGIPLLALSLLAGCGNEPTNPGPSGDGTDKDTARVLMTFNITGAAGSTPLALDSTMTSESGISYKVSKLICYIHGITLTDSAGNDVPVQLVDASKTPLAYNTALVNYEQPATATLHVLAPRGNYRGMNFSIGVPQVGANGDTLNHADASAMDYPLNVDADMYWGWKSGYIFLKIEGTADNGVQWQKFFYHIGDDKRLMPVRIETPFTVAKNGTSSRTLEMNINRLFVTPVGEHRPNLAGGTDERTTHGGTTADIMSRNVVNSGFVTLK